MIQDKTSKYFVFSNSKDLQECTINESNLTWVVYKLEWSL